MRQILQQSQQHQRQARNTPRAAPPATPIHRIGSNQARLRQISPRLPARLEIGAANDLLEREADRAADQVMRMPEGGHDLSAAPVRISRKCDACEDKDGTLQRLADASPGPGPAEAPKSVHEALGGAGRPLDAATLAFFTPRMGRDLSAVRIHDDRQAAASARDIGARAYTVGAHIAFAQNAYSPHTEAGKHLLAHELAHTVQQGAIGDSGAPLRRATDFDITGVDPNAAAQPNRIFFDIGSSAIPATELPKVKTAAAPPGRSLTLKGTSSEEGTPAGNLALVNSRIAAVQMALQTAGHTGPEVADPEPAAGAGQIDYRSVRTVEIIPAGGHSSTSACTPTPAVPNPQDRPCGGAFAAAQPQAVTQVGAAIAALPLPASKPVIDSLFPGVAVSTISKRLTDLLAQLNVMGAPTGKACHNTCDSNCGRPAYMDGQGATAVMTLCPDFDTSGASGQIYLLMHEGMHATPGAPVEDQSYDTQRAIKYLSGAQAETNTDSYVTLIQRLQPGASAAAPGGPPADTLTGMTGPEQDAARKALAFTEKWVEVAEWDTSQLYGAIGPNVGRAGGWDPAYGYHAMTQHVIGWLLGLTDPGPGPAAPFPNAPVKEDAVKVAGIHDRYNRMNQVVDRRVVAVTKGAADQWSTPASAASVTVSDAFFAKGAGDQVEHLITLLAAALGDIPPTQTARYAQAADQIRWHKTGIGP